MSAGTASLTKSNFSEIHIEIVGDYDNIFCIYFEILSTGMDAFPREVHVRLWFQEEYLLILYVTGCVESLVSFFPFFCTHLRSEIVQKKKPDIVTSKCVFFSGISEANNEVHFLENYELRPACRQTGLRIDCEKHPFVIDI